MPQHPRPRIQATPVGDVDPYRPTRQRPVRLRARHMPTDAHFEPHEHDWAQLAYCASGTVQVTVYAPRPCTYIVPPLRAVWVAPGARHAVSVLQAAHFRTLYLHRSVTPPGWADSRVIVVSDLLRELIHALEPPECGPAPPQRQTLLSQLVLDEIARAHTQTLGVRMPDPLNADKRLRTLCDTVLREPARRATLADWAADCGASERTMARLFRDELGISYQQWRQQVVLAQALPLLARGEAVGMVAAATGYGSESAFAAMFRKAMGQPPSAFQDRAGLARTGITASI